MSGVDPFSPEADPGRHEEDEARVGRRTVLLSLAVLPAVTAGAAGCTTVAPACPTQPLAGGCPHRFCRYHRG
jgi:hypothetical protein